MTKGGKETNLWAQVTPEMMSDEESDGNVYIRHQPSYRSNGLNAFIKKLDLRLEADGSNRGGRGSAHPRLERRLGSPREKNIPVLAKKWTIRKEQRPHNHVNNPVLETSDSQVNCPVPNAEVQASDSQENEDAMEGVDNADSDGDSSSLEISDSDSDSDMY